MTARGLLLLFLSLALAGCTTPRTVTIPVLPAWIPAAEIDGATLRAAAQREGQVIPEITDERFTLVSAAWLADVLPWTWQFAQATGLAYTRESFDCDKFAKAFTLAAEISAARAGVAAQPIVARIYVFQLHAWGGVPAGGQHALNLVATDAGLIVVEPQTRQHGPLATYPNLIYAAQIGG